MIQSECLVNAKSLADDESQSSPDLPPKMIKEDR